MTVFPVLLWGVPGGLWIRRIRPRATPLEWLTWSLAAGAVTVVPISYTLCFVLRSPLTPTTQAVAALVSAALALGIRRPVIQATDQTHTPLEGYVGTALVVCFAAALTLYTAPKAVETTEIWAPCIHESAFLMLEDGSGHGLQVYDPSLNDWVSHRTMRTTEPAWGLSSILGHQRPGSMASIAQVIAIHGSAGPVIMTFIDYLLILGAAALLITKYCSSWLLSVFGAGAFLLGTRHVSLYMVNENMLALALILIVMSLLCRTEGYASLFISGLAFSLAVGIRPVVLTALPAALWCTPQGRRARPTFATAVLLGLLPWLATHAAAYGHALYHPSLDVPTLKQTFLGFTFEFHPLNFPIADQLLRPADGLAPLLVSMPLEHTAAFGFLFCIIACLGVAVCTGKERIQWLLWGLPIYVLLLLIVALDYEKQSYALLAFAPLPMLYGRGAGAVASDVQLTMRQKLIAGIIAIALLPGLRAVAPTIEFSPDPRPQYVRPTISSGDPRYAVLSTPEARWQKLLHIQWHPQVALEGGLPWDLLQHAAPPQRQTADYETPVMLWRDADEFHHELTLSAQKDIAREDLVHQLGDDCGTRGSVVLFDLRLPTPIGGDVSLTVRASGHRTLDVALHSEITDQRSQARVTFGVHDTALDDIQQVNLTLNGTHLAAQAVMVEEPTPTQATRRTLRLISNTPWQPVSHNGQVRLSPGARPNTCSAETTPRGTIQLGPGFATISTPSRSCTIRIVDELPAHQFESPCQ
ncbi:MAG: hypothetical protein VX223_05040 [Myxococcota bacterium]|nr:hypothetical protein [Myxococcota bacterium]